jgi:alpha 1,2-mannosyltransferase
MAENGVILYMSRMRDVPLLYRSLSMLGWNFKHIQEYPIVVFHDDIDKGTIANLMVELHKNLGFIPNLKFERLDFVMPEWVSEDPAKYTVPLDQAWMGYRHMCRYFSGGIYRDPRLLKYDYYWRLDSDSYIYSPINYDPFEYMAKNNKEYACMGSDDGECDHVVVDLWEETQRFMKTHNIPMTKSIEKTVLDGKWTPRLYYTNFEMGKFSFFRSEKYMAYFDHLDATGNIFYKRWGDTPIHWFGVNMLLEQEKIWCVKDIAYQHQAWIKNLSALPNKEIPQKIMNLIDGNLQHRYSRLERITFALNRYKAGGPEDANFGE